MQELPDSTRTNNRFMPLSTHSDSEDDPDYVPPADEHDSDSSDEQDPVEPLREPGPADSTEHDTKRHRDALWASFQASVATQPAPSLAPPPPSSRVKVAKTYLFAGKHVTEVVEVPEDSEDARTWPRAEESGAERDARGAEAAPSTPEPTPPTPAPARAGPRKPRTVLPSLPTSRTKKITTLDKSAMDWRAHVSQSGDVKDELDANRRGGGYLEKVDFLQRVQERRDDAFEASKLSKRRKI